MLILLQCSQQQNLTDSRDLYTKFQPINLSVLLQMQKIWSPTAPQLAVEGPVQKPVLGGLFSSKIQNLHSCLLVRLEAEKSEIWLD